MEGRELQHFFHEHPLILKAEQSKTNDHPEAEIECDGCGIPISGPFYSCEECRYFLHKVCAEVPSELNHPLHPQHPLTLLERSPSLGTYRCDSCGESGSRFVYNCSACDFDVDMNCASATRVVHDKCHTHPLTPIQVPVPFTCHICLKKEEGLSYKCNICPFWVHQNCTLMTPSTAEHIDHSHVLKLFPSIPFEYSKFIDYCDICHNKLFMFQCIYGCEGCMFFAHVSCATSETIQSPSRDQFIDVQSAILLPMKQDSTDLISRFVGNYIDEDANIDDIIDHFDHEHPLFLIDEKTTGNKTCEACAVRISAPSYGCVDCDYFLHKCCTDLPKQIQNHPLHPEHQLTLQSAQMLLLCDCCRQFCNSFIYKCSECEEDIEMDIKCGSILEGAEVYHEAHRHPLFPIIKPSSTFCTACGHRPYSGYILKCDTCSFELCYRCAMAPPVVKHRYGKSEPFILTYSPPVNHFDEYICELCLKKLNPKLWFYHCVFADQFVHIECMLESGADSNIKYRKSYMFEEVHEHELTTYSCSDDTSRCSNCRRRLRNGFCAGLECIPCNFRIHATCLPPMSSEKRELQV